MEKLVIPDDSELLKKLVRIRDSLIPSSTRALYRCYIRNLQKCSNYLDNKSVREKIGLKGYEKAYLRAIAAVNLFNTRPTKEKIEVFKDLKLELSGLLNGTLVKDLENAFGIKMPVRQRVISIYNNAELIDEFPIRFLG